jgi:hypothetical protein
MKFLGMLVLGALTSLLLISNNAVANEVSVKADFVPSQVKFITPEINDPAVRNFGGAWILTMSLSNLAPGNVDRIISLIERFPEEIRSSMADAVLADIQNVKDTGRYFTIDKINELFEVDTGTYISHGQKITGPDDRIFNDPASGTSLGIHTFEYKFDDQGKVIHFAHYSGEPKALLN